MTDIPEGKHDSRLAVINAVKTPLGFFTLAVLVVEILLGLLAHKASGTDFTILLVGMVILMFFLVASVVYLAVANPSKLTQTNLGSAFNNDNKELDGNSAARSWENVESLLKELHSLLVQTSYHPDVVVGLAREGSIVASLLSLNWRLRPLGTLDRQYVTRQGITEVHILDTLHEDIVKGSKILLVDSEVNSGISMKTAKEYLLKNKRADTVKTMVLAKSTTSSFTPDYYGMTCSQRLRWPWEITEEAIRVRHGTPSHLEW